jgi:hypothetical protein
MVVQTGTGERVEPERDEVTSGPQG